VVLRADTSAGRLADSEAVAHARALLADVGVAITVQVRSLPAGKARSYLLRLDTLGYTPSYACIRLAVNTCGLPRSLHWPRSWPPTRASLRPTTCTRERSCRRDGAALADRYSLHHRTASARAHAGIRGASGGLGARRAGRGVCADRRGVCRVPDGCAAPAIPFTAAATP
jgi:hypothetical protein